MTPEDVSHRLVERWNADDTDSLANVFADDADFVNVVDL